MLNKPNTKIIQKICSQLIEFILADQNEKSH